jgi:TolB-like protein/cytochrome c-type biogenesis protein CcmH/NrfG
VLPFVNLSTGKSNDVIVDGMTEGIITALARFKQLFVIARNSTFTYKGKAVKVQQVAEELGVRYVLEGSVQLSKDRIRVTAQLIDAIADTHLWVERYDRPLTDVFQVQDEVTRKIVGSLAGKLEQAEMARASLQHPDSLDAYGLAMRGREFLIRYTPADTAKARELCEKAIALDPNYARAYVWFAWTHLSDYKYFRPAKPQESYQKALDLASKAGALDPSLGDARRVLGQTLLYGRKYHEALAQYEEGLKANPNDADILAFCTEVYTFMGHPEEAIQRIKQAMRLNPYHLNWYWWQLAAAQYFAARDYEGAIETLRQMSPLGFARSILAASLAYLGRMEEAHVEAEKFLQENPSFSASHYCSIQPFLHEKDRQHAVEGFIKAGLPR